MTVAEQAAESTAQQPVHTRALIIGTGFSGLGMAIELQQQGVDFLILEKADEIGGTWRDNTYPGAACDVPSHLYSFSFEPKPDWRYVFSYQPEILDYLKGVTDKYGLRRYIKFNSHVTRAHWDDAEYRWHVFTESRAGVRRAVSDLRRRRTAHSVAARHTRHRRFRGPGLPFRAVGPRRRPDRQTGGGHRDRRQRHPGRARAGEDRRPSAAVSAHGRLDHATDQLRLPGWLRRAFEFVPGLRAAWRAATTGPWTAGRSRWPSDRS